MLQNILPLRVYTCEMQKKKKKFRFNQTAFNDKYVL